MAWRYLDYQIDVYDKVTTALQFSEINPCDTAHEALKAVAEFAVAEETHCSPMDLAVALLRLCASARLRKERKS